MKLINLFKTMTLVIVILCTVGISNDLNAQTLQQRLANKLAKKIDDKRAKNGKGPSKLDPNVSQAVTAAEWEDGTYDIYDFNGDACNKSGGKTTLKFIKKDGKVVSVSKDGSDPYVADQEGISEFIRYFRSEGDYKIIFTDKWAFIFTGEEGGKGKYFIEKLGRYADAKMVEEYVKNAKVNQAADIEAYEKNQAALASKKAEEQKAIWSIEGKKVTKIAITDIKAPYSFGYYRPFSFQVTATLADGKTISTKDGGFWSDYTISYKNGDVSNGTVQDTKFITGDKIVVEVKSKFDGSIKATADVVMDYSETLTFSNQSNNWGESAFNYRLEVKERPHAVTGKPVIMIKSIDLSGYAKPKYIIIDATKTLNISTNGANGYKTVGTGNSTGPGANAGDGGNITVIKDPSVKNFNINYTMDGGTGGAGTAGYNRGRDGRDGVYKEEVRKVTF